MKAYHDLCRHILDHGVVQMDRTGVGTKSVFGYQSRFNLKEGFPLVTTKKMNFPSIISELLWFIEGSTDERRLAEIRYSDTRENLIGRKTIWTANADAQGKALGYTNNDLVKELGPIYGKQWRDWSGGLTPVDQLSDLVNGLIHDPYSRRHILTAWNPGVLSQVALPACHTLVQFDVRDGAEGKELSCSLYSRSSDVALGWPYNVASYAALTHMLARVTGYQVGDLIITLGNAHIYLNHIPAIQEQLSRQPYALPVLKVNPVSDINAFTMNDFQLADYICHPAMKMEMAV